MTDAQQLHEALKKLTKEFPGWAFSVIAVPLPSDRPQALCWANVPNPRALHEFIAGQDYDKAVHEQLMEEGDHERG